jgi:hypothetical protein
VEQEKQVKAKVKVEKGRKGRKGRKDRKTGRGREKPLSGSFFTVPQKKERVIEICLFWVAYCKSPHRTVPVGAFCLPCDKPHGSIREAENYGVRKLCLRF